MWRRISWAIACVGGVAIASAGAAAQAQAVSPPTALPPLDRPQTFAGPSLSLNDAIDEALRSNPTLIALQREFEAVRQRPAESHALPAPTVSGQIWQWPINTVNPLNTNMYMFLIEQDIPGRGKRDLRAAVAQKDADRAANDVAVTARQTLSDLKHAYAALFVARKAAGVFSESATALRQLADAAEVKYASGRGSQQEALKPVVELSKLYDDALMFQQQADLASAQLNALMGRLPDAPIGPLQEITEPTALPTLDALTGLAIDHQPTLQGARLDIEHANAERALAKSGAKPDFMLQGGYMLMPHNTDAWTVQVGITWPGAPWAHTGIDARIAETTAEVSAAEARLRADESVLRLTVQQAYTRVTIAQQRAALLQTTILPQSRQTFEASRAAYESDRVDLLTLLEGQRSLLNVQLDYFHILGDLAEAQADLEHAVGVTLGSATSAVANKGASR